MRRGAGGLGAALALLTRLPVRSGGADDLGPALPWFPVVGCLVGLLLAAAGAAGRLAWGPAGAIAAVLVAEALLTGGLHDDGVADTADALAGGWEPGRRLAILRDSRVGAAGAQALVLLAALRAAFLLAIAPSAWWVALPAAHALARGLLVPLAALLPAARPSGLGAAVRAAAVHPGRPLLAGLILLAALLLLGAAGPLPIRTAATGLLLATAAALLAAAAAAAHLQRRFGGLTGDLLGACCAAAELAALAAWGAG